MAVVQFSSNALNLVTQRKSPLDYKETTMATNTSNNPAFLYENITQNPTVQNPTTSYTVAAGDNAVICGANSLAITLNASSNSPVYITSIDGTTQRTGCTVLAVTAGGTQDWVIADGGCSAYCIRIGPASQNFWAVIGAKTAS